MSTIEQQANRWVVREKNGPLDEGERAALDAWRGSDVRHQGAYLRALAIHAALEDAVAGEAAPAANDHAAAPRRPGRRAALWYGAMAASLAVAVGAGMFMAQPRPVTYATVTGEFRRVPLGDHSVAHINSGSQIIVTLTEGERHVELVRGEAWFDVAKDKSRPFVVAAGNARARAVGTSFSVARRPDGADILVTEGVVEAWRQDGEGAAKVVLAAGDSARVPARAGQMTVAREPEEVARKLAWRDGKMVFRNQTLTTAVAEFNRYSRKPIVVADSALAGRTLVGRYKVDDPELFARDVAAYLRVPVSITHEKIILGDVRLLDGAAEPGNNKEAGKQKN
ncbi:FecR domain-containing protein [Massilia sp. METH4]|uniref:FecR family protein n=1 Tax=Massilia sp. METH4 TaxID=3123041 RepID=UPI0030CE22E4